MANKISIKFSEIIEKLHNVAIENSKTSNLTLLNSILVSQGKTGNYNPHILVKKEDGGDFQDSEKNDVLKFIKTYVKYFVGEDESERIQEKDLKPLTNVETDSDDKKPEDTPEDTETTSESLSFLSRIERQVSNTLQMIFESEDKKDNNNLVCKGFAVDYVLMIQGEPVSSIPGLASKANSFMSSIWADLANLEIKDFKSGKSIGIGSLIPDLYRRVTGTPININDVDNHIRNIFHNDFPESDPTVKTYTIDAIKNKLQSLGKWSPDYLKLFDGCEYAVTIKVTERDSNYPKYTNKKIAEICTRAFGDSTKLIKMNRNEVTEKQVIRVDNYKSEFKIQSIYDKRHNSSKGSPSSTSESLELKTINNIIVESILDKLFLNEELIESETSATSAEISASTDDSSELSIKFLYKNPEKKNSVEQVISAYTIPKDNLGKIDTSEVEKDVPDFDNFDFIGWNPDPNEYTKDNIPNNNILVIKAQFEKKSDGGYREDLFIIPHKNLVSKNRKDNYKVGNDGTVEITRSKDPYKASDFIR